MAVYRCAGWKRRDRDGKSLCEYEASHPWPNREPCPGCGRLYNCEKVGAVKKIAVAAPTTLATLSEAPEKPRISTGIAEVDEVLGGGGIWHDGVVMISGPPGCGKSTLLLQIVDKVATERKPVTYVAPEMSADNLGLFARRMGVKNPNVIVFGLEGNIYKVTSEVEKNGSKLMIVDSLQTSFLDDCRGAEGSAEQCKAVATYLTWWAKKYGVAIFIVSHVNKEGDLAGPKAAEHLVDGTLEFDPAPEMDEDGQPTERTKHWRRLTSGPKFRLGESLVSRTFEMTVEGIKPVKRKPSPFLRPV
jgi:DNA repair protein RadA/Sms